MCLFKKTYFSSFLLCDFLKFKGYLMVLLVAHLPGNVFAIFQIFSAQGQYLRKCGFESAVYYKNLDSPRGVCFFNDSQLVIRLLLFIMFYSSS